jgi:polyphenol oxidase
VTTKLSENLRYIKWPTSNVLAFSTTRLPLSNIQTSKSLPYLPSKDKNSTTCQSTFEAFNLGDHVGDCQDTVAGNRKQLLVYLPKASKIQWLEQVHGNNVVLVKAHDKTSLVADAAITRNRHIALAIMTADCLPILLTNKAGNEIAAIHAGWRPLAANIIERTLANMHSSAEQLYVWLGPCIGPTAFEVGQEVKQMFCDISPQFEIAFSPVKGNEDTSKTLKYFADLQMIATLQLNALGVKNISKIEQCTYHHNDLYYSYRRDGKTGRMASIICIA